MTTKTCHATNPSTNARCVFGTGHSVDYHHGTDGENWRTPLDADVVWLREHSERLSRAVQYWLGTAKHEEDPAIAESRAAQDKQDAETYARIADALETHLRRLAGARG